jgi:hypothetical protein
MWKNRAKYKVLIDNKLVSGTMAAYQYTDIASFSKNYNRAYTKNPKTYMFTIDMLTEQAYQEHLKIPLDTVPNLVFIPTLLKYVQSSP